MNRPANPYRDRVQHLESAGNQASGRGLIATANWFWRQARDLKSKGQQEVDAEMERRQQAADEGLNEMLNGTEAKRFLEACRANGLHTKDEDGTGN